MASSSSSSSSFFFFLLLLCSRCLEVQGPGYGSFPFFPFFPFSTLVALWVPSLHGGSIVCVAPHPVVSPCSIKLGGDPHERKRHVLPPHVAKSQFRPPPSKEKRPSARMLGRDAERWSNKDRLASFTSLLQGCVKRNAFSEGRKLHLRLVSQGLEPDVPLGTALIHLYTKCGKLGAAREVFDKLGEPDLLAWNMMLVAHAKCAPFADSFALFDGMERRGISPNEVTFVGILSAAANLSDCEKGRKIHASVVKLAVYTNVFVLNAVIDMYVKCGLIHDASHVFSVMAERDVVSWNTMIGGWAKLARAEEAFALFDLMVHEGMLPNDVTFLSLMSACATLEDLELGKQLHFQLGSFGIALKPSLRNALIDMYSKCASLKDAWDAFQPIHVKDEISWNAIIGGHLKNGQGGKVSMLCHRMMVEGASINEITFLSALNACATLGDLKQGKHVHARIDIASVESNLYICSALVDMYAKCGDLDNARQLLDLSSKQNVVLWTALIAGYSKYGQPEEAFRLLHQMESKEIRPNEVTFVSVLDASTLLGSLDAGQVVHSYVLERNCRHNTRLENALVNMYAKCGSVDDAWRVFENMNRRDRVSWTSIIAGYASLELFEQAFWVFGKMIEEGIEPDGVTFVTMSNLCANIAALEQGRLIHACIVKSAVAVDAFVGNSLIDMYAKCGNLREAQFVLGRLCDRDIVSWNTMLSGCAQSGQGKELLWVVDKMDKDGVELNQITLLSILSAFGRSGLHDEALSFFAYMDRQQRATPMLEHYACIVDLLARAGHVKEAAYCIQKMPFQPSATGWGAVLGACKLHGFVDLAEYAVDQIIQLEPENSAAYIVLSNVYATA